ncbi:hypothetical protein RYZ26_19420 [Terasakiella sp. A23]|uniref:hypothetical protein n=1 Tax=Terasakiella sp. FCG-A23 TaxID=3080561 RepID=UPI0029546493|nr:hypothetical protein [Terasakiella sp. A23]MDV7341780.1 hypothetical protein [Terasakiella sp. A23]
MTTTFIQTQTGMIEAQTVSKPSDRLFRKAWLLDGAVIEVDMVQAREICREKIRTARQPELDRLDADYMKALEAGDTAQQQSIAAQKQALRDATNEDAIEAATTAEELQAVKPAGLDIS